MLSALVVLKPCFCVSAFVPCLGHSLLRNRGGAADFDDDDDDGGGGSLGASYD